MPRIDPRELNDLADFAARGGLSRGVATTDCVAEEPDQLMFIKGDVLILLRELPDYVLASCEGVVGWVKLGQVEFDNVAGSSANVTDYTDLPRTILTEPSPPSTTATLPAPSPEPMTRRVSGPFELESPRPSPSIDQTEFQLGQEHRAPGGKSSAEENRESIASIASSEVLGGIGGFMMDPAMDGGDRLDREMEELQDVSPKTPDLQAPDLQTDLQTDLPTPDPQTPASPIRQQLSTQPSTPTTIPDDTDSLLDNAESKRTPQFYRDSTISIQGVEAMHAARAVMTGIKPVEEEGHPGPRLAPLDQPLAGRSIATELRLRIQRERERELERDGGPGGPTPRQDPPTLSEAPRRQSSLPQGPLNPSHTAAPTRPPRSEHRQPSPVSALDSDESAHLATPHATDDPTPLDRSPLDRSPLLASPMPFDDAPKSTPPSGPVSPMLPPPPGWSPNLAYAAWTPGSPASPHSIAATRHAVAASKSTPEGKRPRGLTLVGRMDTDLGASRGPVPITFLVGGPEVPGANPPPIGLGLPSGRKSPVTPEGRARSPLASPMPPMPDDIQTIRSQPSRFPTPQRSVTSPPPPAQDTTAGPRPFLAARPRARSFSATVAKAMGKREPLSIDTSQPPLPAAQGSTRKPMFSFKSTPKASPTAPKPTPIAPKPTPISPVKSPLATLHPNNSSPSLPSSARSSSFSFSSKGSKTPRKPARALPSPVSHRDYEETVNAEGLDFELVQPKRSSPAPSSPTSLHTVDDDQTTITSSLSFGKLLPETDEWGFVKDKSMVPEIFKSRAAPEEHRAMEQKWLAIIATPIPSGGAPKKVRKLATDHGIPSSLRGKVWAWFMSPAMSARAPGLYEELCRHDKAVPMDEIDRDVATLWSDHSIFHATQAPGRADLRSILRAYSNFVPSGYSTPMCHLAGTLLVHAVAEEGFWLLAGLLNTTLREYYVRGGPGLQVDAGVFDAVMKGSEKDLSAAFKQAGVKTIDLIETWFKQIFIRCLPWPTTLRVIDAVFCEGPRFLFIAALTILTLSRERLLALPRTKEAILGYLQDLPQDSLLLPENFLKACDKVRFREEDYKRLRVSVEKEMGL